MCIYNTNTQINTYICIYRYISNTVKEKNIIFVIGEREKVGNGKKKKKKNETENLYAKILLALLRRGREKKNRRVSTGFYKVHFFVSSRISSTTTNGN